MKIFYMVLGTISLVLGAIGIVLPSCRPHHFCCWLHSVSPNLQSVCTVGYAAHHFIKSIWTVMYKIER